MEKGVMDRGSFFGELGEWLASIKEAVETGDEEALEKWDASAGAAPRVASVVVGETEEGPHIVDFSMSVKVVKGYEAGFDRDVPLGTEWWPELIREGREGRFDKSLFLDMATFAFEQLVEGADEERVSRRDAYLALAMKEFSDLQVEVSREFEAAQLVAEALSAQACGGWQKVDGKVSTEKLVVFDGNGERILVGMSPCDLTPLLESL